MPGRLGKFAGVLRHATRVSFVIWAFRHEELPRYLPGCEAGVPVKLLLLHPWVLKHSTGTRLPEMRFSYLSRRLPPIIPDFEDVHYSVISAFAYRERFIFEKIC